MNQKRNWIIGIILTGTVGAIALQNGLAGSIDTPISPTTPGTSTPLIADAPTDTATYESCAYTWATHDAPELTDKLQSQVRSLNLDASINASLYGENCTYSDGHSTFGVMETDFYVHLPVDDLRDEEGFGNWMAKVLPLIIKIPRVEIQGNYGFVEFWFEKTDTKTVVVRVPIQQYMDKAQGMTGVELFHIFYTKP